MSDRKMLVCPMGIEATEPVTIVMVFSNQKEIWDGSGAIIELSKLYDLLPDVKRTKAFEKAVEHRAVVIGSKAGDELTRRLSTEDVVCL